MSFTNEIKNEISMIELDKIKSISFLSGLVRNSKNKIDEKIYIKLENAKVTRKIYKIIKDIYGSDITIQTIKKNNLDKKTVYEIIIENNVNAIINDLQLNKKSCTFDLLDEDLTRSYLMGVFLSCGSVNNPKTSNYHLEFSVFSMDEAIFIVNLLKYFYINGKFIKRDKGIMVYVKESEKIGDFLRIINANSAVLYFENIRIYRDHKNMTNRLNNCEQANVEKSVNASNTQLDDIKIIKDNNKYEFLSAKLKEAIVYREKYPDVSLNDLSNIISIETEKELTKSGLNHRFRKIHEIADKIRTNLN